MVHQLKGDGTAKSIIIGLIGPIFFALSGLIIGVIPVHFFWLAIYSLGFNNLSHFHPNS